MKTPEPSASPPPGSPGSSSAPTLVESRTVADPGAAAAAAAAGMRPVVPDHELIRPIGRGAYGEVWLARNVMGTYRAVKVVWRAAFEREKPFEREFTGIQKFEPISRTHPALVDILQVGRTEGCFYYVMELADDVATGQEIDPERYVPRTLRKEVEERGRLPVERCVEVGLALASGLQHLHGHGLIHRDIKPSNLIFVHGQAKLADIGLVAEASEAKSFVGTEGFIPPEGPGTASADVYSLGKVLYEMATGKDRHEFPELPETPGAEADAEEALLELNTVVLKACQNEVKLRYATAEALRQDLVLLQGGKSVKRTQALERRLRRLARVSAVAALIALVTIVAGAYFRQQTARESALRAEAERQRWLARKARYAAEMNLAWEAWHHGQWSRAAVLHGRIFDEAVESPKMDPRGLEWRLFAGHLRVPFRSKVLWGEDLWTASMAFSPDGTRLAGAGAPGTNAIVYSLDQRRPTAWLAHPDHVQGIDWSSDGRWLATACLDGNARLWDAQSGKLRWTFAMSNAVNSVAISPDCHSLAALGGREFSLWDTVSGERLFRVATGSTLPGEPLGLVFAPDGGAIAYYDRSGAVVLWDTETKLVRFRWTSPYAYTLRFSPDGRLLAAAEGPEGVRVWETAGGELRATLTNFLGRVAGIAFSRDGEWLVAESGDRLSFFDTDSWQRIGEPVFVLFTAPALQVSPDGRHLGVGCRGGVGLLAASPSPDGPRNDRIDLDRSVSSPFDATGETLLRVNPTNRLLAEVWSTSDWSPRRRLRLEHAIHAETRVMGPQCRWIATLGSRGRGGILVMDGESGRVRGELQSDAEAIVGLCASPDGALLAVAREDRQVELWDVARAVRIEAMACRGSFGGWYGRLRFSPDGKQLATGYQNGSVEIWEVPSGVLKRTLEGAEGVTDMVFLPGGEGVAVARWSGLQVHDLTGKGRVTALSVDQAPWVALGVSPDGARLVAGGLYGGIRMWDLTLPRPAEVASIDIEPGRLRAFAFVNDGNTLISAGLDHARPWKAPTMDEIHAEEARLVE